jgi:hypothetical protein
MKQISLPGVPNVEQPRRRCTFCGGRGTGTVFDVRDRFGHIYRVPDSHASCRESVLSLSLSLSLGPADQERLDGLGRQPGG